MRRLINYFGGNIEIEIEGAFPERFLNACSQNGITFWGLERPAPERIRIRVNVRDFNRLRPYAKRTMCRVKIVGREGVPFFLWRFRKRYVFIAGMVLFFVIMWTMSQYIWQIEVTGNTTVSSSEILYALEELGVGQGTYGPSVDPEAIRQKMLLKINKLSWLTVNVNGSRAEVIVRERKEAPEVIDESVTTNVIAAKTGIITKMQVYKGEPQTEVGRTVLKGELIVSGVIDSEKSGATRFVHAMADVYARTWYNLSAGTPLQTMQKDYTGKQSTHIAVIIAGKRINLYFNGGISFECYDKIVERDTLTAPGGQALPIVIVTEKYVEYNPVTVEVGREAAEEQLKGSLTEELKGLIGDGTVTSSEFSVSEQSGMLVVAMASECEEQIGKLIELPK